MTNHSHHISQYLTREQVRSIDQTAIDTYGMTGLVLMENAGRGAAECMHSAFPQGCVGILCGKGNNAGDGYVIARHLELMGREVQILQLFPPEELTGDAKANWMIAHQANIGASTISNPSELPANGTFDVLVDCLLGTGASGNPRSPIKEAVQWANQMHASRIAIDIPTGLNCETGEVGDPCFQADLTCTFVANKVGFKAHAAQRVLGSVQVISIGVPLHLLKQFNDAS